MLEALIAFVMIPYAVPATLLIVSVVSVVLCLISDKRNGYL